LYPFGRGGPSDFLFKIGSTSKYHRHVLRRGGGKDGRRFQNHTGSIFATYTYEIKRRIGGLAYAATKKTTGISSDSVEGEQTNDEQPPSKEVVESLIECLQAVNESEEIDVEKILQRIHDESAAADVARDMNNSNSEANMFNLSEPSHPSTRAAIQEREANKIRSLLNRLVPYAKQAPGTPMHINYERKNMHAMVTSPVITNDSVWRWFVTFAFADLQESRLFEVILDNTQHVDSTPDKRNWEERLHAVTALDKKTRRKMLRSHPALVARLFDSKQECIWAYILAGFDAPLGVLVDFMRRVEV
jgi:hypothetical protein